MLSSQIFTYPEYFEDPEYKFLVGSEYRILIRANIGTSLLFKEAHSCVLESKIFLCTDHGICTA